MADDITVRVEGLARLQRATAGLAGDLTDPRMAERPAEGGAAVVRRFAPRRTGALSRSFASSREGVTSSSGYVWPVNSGVPSRGMAGQRFVERGVDAMNRDAGHELETEIAEAIRGRGLA